MENGFAVAFYRLEDLLHAMKRDTDIPPQRLRGKKYMSVALLIGDPSNPGAPQPDPRGSEKAEGRKNQTQPGGSQE